MLPRDPIPAGPITLRVPVAEDAEAIVRACADPAIVRYLPAVPVPYPREAALTWIGRLSVRVWENGGASFVIADSATDEALGAIALAPVADENMDAFRIGYWIAPQARGRGLATTAVRTLSAWGHEHGVARIELLAEVENIPSQRVALAAGYRREGIHRAALPLRDGSRADMVGFARLAGDPPLRITPYLPFFPGEELCDGTVRLTRLTAADAAELHRMLGDPQVLRHHLPPVRPTLEEVVRRCRYTGAWWLHGDRAEIAVRDARSGAFAGHLQLIDISPQLGQATIGYSLLPEHRGRGLMTRAVSLLTRWAFTATPLQRIIAVTAPDNVRSRRVLERCGFTREALLRGARPGPGGRRRDDLQWVLLRPW